MGEPAPLHMGEQTSHSNLQQLSPDQLFLAFDTSGLPAGCSLQATIDNGRDGSSQPFTLARILRTPQVESFTVSSDEPQNGTRQYRLTGENLEMIQKLGWDDSTGVEISGLPMPLPGPGLKQSIEIRLPDPPNPATMLCVWLRGDKQARTSTIKAPALPAPLPPVVPLPTLTPSLTLPAAPEPAPPAAPPAAAPAKPESTAPAAPPAASPAKPESTSPAAPPAAAPAKPESTAPAAPPAATPAKPESTSPAAPPTTAPARPSTDSQSARG